MTKQELIDYYVGLLILQYRSKPKARGHIAALIDPLIMDKISLEIQGAYNIDTAVGVQLDVLGKYAGVTRQGNGLAGQPIVLADSDYRQLIKLAVLKNSTGSSLAEIQDLIDMFFPGVILVFDHQNMQMSFYISVAIGSLDLAQLVVTKKVLPVPMGVQIGSTIYSVNINDFFGFRSYELPEHNCSPLNTYESYQMTYPWLRYEDALSA